MEDKELIQWLKDNSSGVYRPSKEAAERIEELLEYNELLERLLSISITSKQSKPENISHEEKVQRMKDRDRRQMMRDHRNIRNYKIGLHYVKLREYAEQLFHISKKEEFSRGFGISEVEKQYADSIVEIIVKAHREDFGTELIENHE